MALVKIESNDSVIDKFSKQTKVVVKGEAGNEASLKQNQKQDKNVNKGNILQTDTDSKSERPPELQFNFDELLSDLRRELSIKTSEEEVVTKNLKEKLRKVSENGITSGLSRSFNVAITRFNNQMALVESDAKQLASGLKVISGLADNISGKVSALDVAKCRVVECMQRVSDLMDLRTCADGVTTAIEQEDYELAAQHIHKFFTLDEAVFQMGEQTEAKDAGQSLGRSYEILREASGKLKSLIEERFDQAVEKNDDASIQRFLKLFPLINEHNNGIKRFSEYLCKKIQQMAEQNYKAIICLFTRFQISSDHKNIQKYFVMLAGGTDDKRRSVLYADSLTMLFEGIAREIRVYETLIDSCYGPDKLLSLIERLQGQCDIESERVIAAFIKNRQYEAKAKSIEKILRNSEKSVPQEKINILELDIVLSEITLMHTRTDLYWRYLKRRLNAADSKTDEQICDQLIEDERRKLKSLNIKQKQERTQKLKNLVLHSLLGTKMQELLDRYVLMEQFYMKDSMLDDVFFIVRKCVRRSLSSSSVDCICAVLNIGVTTLETDFLQHIYADVKAGYPSVGWTAEAYQTAQTAYNVIQHGKTVADAGPEKQKEIFITALNNLRASADCTKTLKKSLMEDFEKHLKELSELEKGKLENTLTQLDDLVRKFDSSANVGVEKLCSASFRPKLKSSAEQYLNVTHTPTENEFTELDADDPFIENFIANLNNQFLLFEPLLMNENYQELMVSVCVEISRQLERVIMKCVYNRLGGLQLDKELRALTSYLSGIAGWIVREKCIRLSQIVSIINVENVSEAIEFYHQLQSHMRMLSSEEAKKILVLRIDLPSEAVKSATF